MGMLATKSLDVTLNDGDREDLDVEFQELVGSLDQLLSEKFNGVRLFDQNVVCGGVKDIPLGTLDLVNNKPTWARHSTRAQTIDVGATGGTLTFSVNSGGDADSYRIYMGGNEVFSAGRPFRGPDSSADYDFTNLDRFFPLGNPKDFGYPTGGWATSGSARNGDDDTFKVSFGPGTPTTYEITYGASNVGEPFNPTQGELEANGGVIRTADMSPGSTTTMLTLQIDTSSIGVIQPGVTFEPLSPSKEIIIGEKGETMQVSAKGFSTMYSDTDKDGANDFNVKTAANAQAALSKLEEEADCVLFERMGAIRAEASRLDGRLHELGDQLVQGEAAYGRIADLDYAKEMTRFATNSLQLNVMTSTMGSANRATDVLMPLTTQQFQSAVTQRFQLL